jgi:RNA polymerase sigma factor (sigma-70 family)
MLVGERPDMPTVLAAQAGDQEALESLIAAYLPLVYNIVGRALDGHTDVDDVVQETMLRVVDGLAGLRDPASFRSWLVAVAMSQVRDRGRASQRMLARSASLDELLGAADPGADFVDLTIVRLGLSGQREEVAAATRWLDSDDRRLLSLWWMEAAGELTRDELAAALQLNPKHAAVRIQRMKAQLETARAVVRALSALPRCEDLETVTAQWDGRPDPLWRKRFGRHTRECARCGGHWSQMVPADRLLVGMALVPLPVGLATTGVFGPGLFGPGAGAGATSVAGLWTHLVVWAQRAAELFVAKPAVAAAVSAAVVTGAATTGYGLYEWTPSPATPPAVATATPTSAIALPPPSAAPPPTQPSTVPSPSTQPVYGHNVDKVEKAPPNNQRPAALPKRPEGTPITGVAGAYEPLKPGVPQYVLVRRTQNVTLRGQGYFTVTYQIPYTQRAGGMAMPSWTGLTGKLFHVASGGGRRMDDLLPAVTAKEPGETFMGKPSVGFTVLPPGAAQMWVREFFYLDGEVTLNNNERGADYNLIANPSTWQEISNDVNQLIDLPSNHVRYGLVRDTGNDGAPIPQYLTRTRPTDPATVPQHSTLP